MPGNKISENNSSLSFGEVSASACRKGSITVEAALAVPVFFMAIISLFYLMEISVIRTNIRAGLQSAGKQVMQEACVLTAIVPSRLERDIVGEIGAERLDRSMIVDGSAGLHCEDSYLSLVNGIGRLTVRYRVRVPIPVFGISPVSYEESVRIKAWTGYEKEFFGAGGEDTVYITETGIVYHRDYHCTHLELSIRMVPGADVETLRNQSGGKYYPCEHCGYGTAGGVYITNNGDRFHCSLSCSGLKRTIYAVPISEAAGKGACSRCGR